jgi:hypothetical protein
LEGARLENVAPHRHERLVDLPDDVGPGEHEIVIAPLERFPPEVIGGEVVSLNARPHGAVVDQHPPVERIKIGGVASC